MNPFSVLIAILAFAAGGALVAGLRSLPWARRANKRGHSNEAQHWRALAGAAYEVQRIADDYQRAVAQREDPRSAALGYQAACRWLLLVVASGPTPPSLRPLVPVLTDARHPEAVATSRAGDEFLEVLIELQNAADDARTHPPSGSPPSEWREFLRLARLSVRGRFRTL